MSERWFYRLNNEEFGPIVSEQVVELIRSQILTSTDWVRTENSSGWSPLGRFDDFRVELDRARSDDLRIADSLDDLTFEFAETSASSSEVHAAKSKGGRERGTGIPDHDSRSNNVADRESMRQLARVDVPVQDNVDTETQEIESPAPETDADDISDNDMTHVRISRSPASTEQSPQSSKGERKKVKRKTTKTEDPLLDEIIRELSERGKPEASSSRTTSGQTSIPTGVSPLSAATNCSVPAASTSAKAPRPVSNPGPPVPNLPPRMNSSTPPAVTPAPVRVKQSFQMPEPKTLGIVGGGLVSTFLVTALMLGWISLPFGSSGGALSGSAGTVVSCYLEFKQFGTAIPAGPDWAAFRSTVEKNIKPVVETSADAKDNVTVAGRKLLELASLQPAGNPEKVKQIGSELDVLIAGIAGTQQI